MIFLSTSTPGHRYLKELLSSGQNRYVSRPGRETLRESTCIALGKLLPVFIKYVSPMPHPHSRSPFTGSVSSSSIRCASYTPRGVAAAKRETSVSAPAEPPLVQQSTVPHSGHVDRRPIGFGSHMRISSAA